MPFEIVRNDITCMQVDAIVNAASRHPRVGAGVDSAVHKKAGPSLLAARKEIGYIAPGTAAITPAYDLNAEYVIHAATPRWIDGQHGETGLLRQAYDMCLELAVRNHCDSIAFPLLASGNHGFPKSKVLQVAIGAFSEFLMEHDMQIYLVVFGKDSVKLSEKLVHSVASFIDENYVETYHRDIYGGRGDRCRRTRYPMPQIHEAWDIQKADSISAAPAAKNSESLDEIVKKKDVGFTETLLRLIKESGKKNSEVYKKANISKQHFSKIINDPNSKPSKLTAISLALALEMDLAGTRDLIGRAGYALTNSSVLDLIVQYFIEHGKYNIIEINIMLYEFGQDLLGSQSV